MNKDQALKITVDAIRLDATLSGEPANLNRVTFWLSELHYGRKWFGADWSHTVPRDIIQTAASIAREGHTPAQLLANALHTN